MNIQEAEALKVQILERRNHLKELDVPLRYSKVELRSGMQGRVNRQNDKRFQKNVTKEMILANRNLGTVNTYIDDLNIYNEMAQPLGTFSTSDETTGPIAPTLTLSKIPKRIALARRRAGDYR